MVPLRGDPVTAALMEQAGDLCGLAGWLAGWFCEAMIYLLDHYIVGNSNRYGNRLVVTMIYFCEIIVGKWVIGVL